MPAVWPPISRFHAGTAHARSVLNDLEFVDRKGWRELYRRTADGTYWRLDTEDKFQERYLVRIDDPGRWEHFDSQALEKQLLLESRGGVGPDACICAGCDALALRGIAFCPDHVYERGVRK